MTKYLRTTIGRLRLIAFLEGGLLLLVFIAVPLKYYWENPFLVKHLGPIHRTLFLLFVVLTIAVSIKQKWKFDEITWKVLLACIVPFGTFYIDNEILSKIEES